MALLLRVTAFIEVSAGVCLLLMPSVVFSLMLGAQHAAAETLFAGRVAGAALLSFGMAIWLTHKNTSQSGQRSLVASMTVYTTAAAMLLAYAGIGLRMVGVLLWPSLVLHAAVAIWCFVCLAGRHLQSK